MYHPQPVYPSPVHNSPSPEYTPSAITTVPELELIDRKKEENVHIKFLDPPASPPPSDIPSGSSQLQIASMHPTSTAAPSLQPELQRYGLGVTPGSPSVVVSENY